MKKARKVRPDLTYVWPMLCKGPVDDKRILETIILLGKTNEFLKEQTFESTWFYQNLQMRVVSQWVK